MTAEQLLELLKQYEPGIYPLEDNEPGLTTEELEKLILPF